jgi:hypothetical protein
VTYSGWKLDDVLDLTLPQVNILFAQMSKIPSPSIVIAAIMKSFEEKSGKDGSVKELESLPPSAIDKATVGGKNFLKSMGIETEE